MFKLGIARVQTGIKVMTFQREILRFSRSNHSAQVPTFSKRLVTNISCSLLVFIASCRLFNMIFTRVVAALLVAAVSAQALYIPDALYAREFEESHDVTARELSVRGLDYLNVVRDLASDNEITVLAARGDEEHVGKAGAKRWQGIRPTVRGVVMNPVDHPHGGGEGRTAAERHPVSPKRTTVQHRDKRR